MVKKSLCMLLAVLLIVGILSPVAFAEEGALDETTLEETEYPYTEEESKETDQEEADAVYGEEESDEAALEETDYAYGEEESDASYVEETHSAYMQGDDYGHFRPLDHITRAEAAAILTRTQIEGFVPGQLPPGMETFDTFADMEPETWFFYYVAWAYYEGLIVGSVPTPQHPYRRFRPGDPITRREFAAMITRTGEILQPTEDSELPFSDWDLIPDWARAYAYTAFQNGWMVGDEEGRFNSAAPITRAEVATAINRMMGRIDGWEAMEGVEVENPADARVFPDVDTEAWYYPAVLAAANNHAAYRDEEGVIIRIRILGEQRGDAYALA